MRRAAVSVKLLACLAFLLATIAVVGTSSSSTPDVPASGAPAAPPSTGEVGSNAPPEVPPEPAPGGALRHLGLDEIVLSVLVLAFGIITLLLQFLLMRGNNFAPDEILKVLSVTLIIVGALFIITAGFDSDQIAPAMGLFGTLAGYLLAKHDASGRAGRERE